MPSMKTRRYRSALLWIGAALLISFAIYRQIASIATWIRVRFAEEQTEVFEQMREKAKNASAVAAADDLSYVLFYYPSGTKQAAGSPLDRVVERARQSAVREIIAVLRAKTGQDFGDDPVEWIEALKGRKPQ